MHPVVLVVADPAVPDALLAAHQRDLASVGGLPTVIDLRAAVPRSPRALPLRALRAFAAGWLAARAIPRDVAPRIRAAEVVVAADSFAVVPVWLQRRRTRASLVLGVPAAVSQLAASR